MTPMHSKKHKNKNKQDKTKLHFPCEYGFFLLSMFDHFDCSRVRTNKSLSIPEKNEKPRRMGRGHHIDVMAEAFMPQIIMPQVRMPQLTVPRVSLTMPQWSTNATNGSWNLIQYGSPVMGEAKPERPRTGYRSIADVPCNCTGAPILPSFVKTSAGRKQWMLAYSECHVNVMNDVEEREEKWEEERERENNIFIIKQTP